MKATTEFEIQINDEEDPAHSDYINHEYKLREEAKQILLSQLVSLAMNFRHNCNLQQFDDFLTYQSFTIVRKPEPDTIYYVQRDAKDILYDYTKEIAQMLIGDGEASTDLYNDYDGMDERVSESDDYWRNPDDAIKVIDELSEFEEEDRGLWEGSDSYRDILSTIAHYTYTNALYHEIESMIESINDTLDRDTITDIEEQILKEMWIEDDYHEMKESNIDTDDFDQVREWAEENLPEFVEERLKQVTKAVEEELK